MDPQKPSLSPSDSATTVRVSSPLNPTSSSASGSDQGHSSRSPSTRGRATTPRTTPPVPSMSLTPPQRSALSLAVMDNDEEVSTFRTRSRSMSQTRIVVDSVWRKVLGSSSAFGLDKEEDRWKDSDKPKRVEIPPEQRESWEYARQRVQRAARSVLGDAVAATHEALALSAELLEFAPVPGLSTVAKTLLQIWDALEGVDMNRLQCLHLTERCADILLAVRQEVYDAGDEVGVELALPVQRLTDSFRGVFVFLQKQNHRPFLKRYLHRDEIRNEISACQNNLNEALGMFSLSIQIRTLKQLQESDRRRQQDMQAIMMALGQPPILPSLQPRGASNALGLIGIEEEYTSVTLAPSPPTELAAISLNSPVASPAIGQRTTALEDHESPTAVANALLEIVSKQNSMDAAADSADLRNLLRRAIAAGSDVAMVETLGVKRNEMAEAVKTLQRALEQVLEGKAVDALKGDTGLPDEMPTPRGKNRLVKMVRRLSTHDARETQSLKRSKTSTSSHSSEDKSTSSSPQEDVDTLEREFLESGIDALKRMSEGPEAILRLPSWTITKFEVERTHKIGIGFFSDVYRGTWRGRTVAIKVLAQTTPRDLFVKEVEIWKKLQNPHVLELYGASSTSGDPPWFCVMPYLKEGTLVEYLRRMESAGENNGRAVPEARNSYPLKDTNAGLGLGLGMGLQVPGVPKGRTISGTGATMIDPKGCDLLKFMYEIAKGMAYLHSQGVLHGDLKASNVLVNDRRHCLITDFGQSEMRSEAFRISGTPPPHGTLRWQAPELMTGRSRLTSEADVYAFAVTSIEILGMGRMPWAYADDDAVRHFVVNENGRPPIPFTPVNSSGLQELLRVCWHRDPLQRPSFSRIVSDLKDLRKGNGTPDDAFSPTQPSSMNLTDEAEKASPDMHPTSVSAGTPPRDILLGGGTWKRKDRIPSSSPGAKSDGTVSTSYQTARESSASPTPAPFKGPPTLRQDLYKTPGIMSRSTSVSRSTSSKSTQQASESDEDGLKDLLESDGYDSPAPTDSRIADIRDERRYRLLLLHSFHPSLVLPLWTPSKVTLGAVGYHSKPQGGFVTLFNAIDPDKAPEFPSGMETVWKYGKVAAQVQRIPQYRSAARKSIDALAGIFSFRAKGRELESLRRYSHPLRANRKAAFMYTEATTYQYLENLDAPKKWFETNVDDVLKVYGDKHRIQREDLCFVIGSLNTADYALFVSHNHPDGQAYFDVLPPRARQPWGSISTGTELSQEGPMYHESMPGGFVSRWKISRNGDPEVSVLLARLRFKTDASAPTSL
ncbi:hypothetical protein CYLTODRAFT_371735 [Cylindrobasidium torrendii FP15055 ss-10]|uniref:Protein kinase domain-containing protein n=1 Tax=Cylindrobasidium torrendii FP15055 ss-10 TaxID=1314674 RepID=A0A0D7BIE0_9AGAR|nr:hypothetical protein CYLTODRAFT_371735 [Cylindrobasidium torrendii FP15055 ss-10]